MDVVDAGLVWIWRQKKRLVSSVLVFSRIRTSLLSQGDRATIRECLRALPNGEKLIPIVTTTLNSSHCRRCCVIKDHLDNNLVRCGVPNPFTDKTVDLGRLPL
ncbi:unnamed protein product [Gongylonema pulchrum]|uniref:Reverse transcriptase n=1 Tax=Gongylonema pulchrum TaxID=637853 RepID=A0A183EGN8_9BILA|nr:unnamed protein product [Gongylonema pulchrum]